MYCGGCVMSRLPIGCYLVFYFFNVCCYYHGLPSKWAVVLIKLPYGKYCPIFLLVSIIRVVCLMSGDVVTYCSVLNPFTC